MKSSAHAGRRLLESLTYSYLGEWITRQKDGVKRGEGGAEDRLAAALELQTRLEAILEGEPPFDIFVRCKPLAEQPIGWEPDLNDGVRVNIRPFLASDLLRRAKPRGPLIYEKDPWPDENDSMEDALRAALVEIGSRKQTDARRRLEQLATEHGPPRGWVWARLGMCPLANALGHLAVPAKRTATTRGGGSAEAMPGRTPRAAIWPTTRHCPRSWSRSARSPRAVRKLDGAEHEGWPYCRRGAQSWRLGGDDS